MCVCFGYWILEFSPFPASFCSILLSLCLYLFRFLSEHLEEDPVLLTVVSFLASVVLGSGF
jgi:hypothetical protein